VIRVPKSSELDVLLQFCCRVLQSVAVCCCVLQCVAVCCSVLQCVAVCCKGHQIRCTALQFYDTKKSSRLDALLQMCCSVLQCVAVCCSVSAARLEETCSAEGAISKKGSRLDVLLQFFCNHFDTEHHCVYKKAIHRNSMD